MRLVLTLSLLGGCSLLFEPGEELEGTDAGTETIVVRRNFTDVIAAPTESLQSSMAIFGGYSGTQEVSTSSQGASVSSDGIQWSDHVQLLADTPLFIRSKAPLEPFQTELVLVEIGSLQLTWAVSTHPAIIDFDTAGSFLWTNPKIRGSLQARCWGGGGGAGTGGGEGFVGGGGGGGGFSEKTVPTEELQAVEVIVVGSGGNGAPSSGLLGTAGGQSLVGAHLAAEGGSGGLPSSLGGGGGSGGEGITEFGMEGRSNSGGDAGGRNRGGGSGASNALDGLAPGGGGGGSNGAGGGGAVGNGAGKGGDGGPGRCTVEMVPR